MIMNAYSFFDVKSGLFSLPFFQIHDNIARRAAQTVASEATSTIGQYPEDFVLYRVGQFDDTLGELIPCAPTISV